MSWHPVPDRAAARTLGDALRRIGYTEDAVIDLLGDEGAGFRPYIAFDPTQPVNQWAELNHSRRWSAWFFWEDGVRQEEHCARCPATSTSTWPGSSPKSA